MDLYRLAALGFDASTASEGKLIRVACSCCEAMVINGHPTHELGCENARHECAGCNELIPVNQKYCQECRS